MSSSYFRIKLGLLSHLKPNSCSIQKGKTLANFLFYHSTKCFYSHCLRHTQKPRMFQPPFEFARLSRLSHIHPLTARMKNNLPKGSDVTCSPIIVFPLLPSVSLSLSSVEFTGDPAPSPVPLTNLKTITLLGNLPAAHIPNLSF